jgi:hypothetical protein
MSQAAALATLQPHQSNLVPSVSEDAEPLFFSHDISSDVYSRTVVQPQLHPGQRFALLFLHVGARTTEAVFFAREDSLVTSRFPGFEKELLQYLPNLLANVKCYNGRNHHFATEMLATEMGHLFEHIWLEVLCTEKIKRAATAHYSGETSWNWKEEQRGIFHITLQAGVEDRALIEEAARASKIILAKILG